jgi:hypothetical protein
MSAMRPKTLRPSDRCHSTLKRSVPSGLCVFHHSFAARGLELIGGDLAITINVNHLKVDDVLFGNIA